jgi:hypothetical protein
MLVVAVVLEWLRPSRTPYVDNTHLLDSVSAYYWTAVRPVFVASLFALGVGMIALRSQTDLEDVLLDTAGALAPVVAFVPVPLPTDCLARADVGCGLPPDVAASVSNNVVAYLVAGSLALVVHAVVVRASGRPTPSSGVTHVGGGLLGLLVVGAGGWLALDPGSFARHAHLAAAVPLFACIVAVVLVNAVSSSANRSGMAATALPLPRRVRVCPRLYWALLVVMVLGVAAAGVLALLDVTERGVLVAEVAVLGPFLAFWLVQTVELWQGEERPWVVERGRWWPYRRPV